MATVSRNGVNFNVKIDDNTAEIIAKAKAAAGRALETIGEQAESYAKEACSPVGAKGNLFPGDLISNIRNSIKHSVDGDELSIGSNLDIAAFAELGTGKLYKPPEGFLVVGVSPGPHHGLDHWWFKKGEEWIMGLPIPPSPFLQPAISGHLDEYAQIIANELK